MKNLESVKTLLRFKSQKMTHCVEVSDGEYKAIEPGVKGEIHSVESRLMFELMGQYPLDEQDQILFEALTNLKWKKDRPEKKPRKEKVK